MKIMLKLSTHPKVRNLRICIILSAILLPLISSIGQARELGGSLKIPILTDLEHRNKELESARRRMTEAERQLRTFPEGSADREAADKVWNEAHDELKQAETEYQKLKKSATLPE